MQELNDDALVIVDGGDDDVSCVCPLGGFFSASPDEPQKYDILKRVVG